MNDQLQNPRLGRLREVLEEGSKKVLGIDRSRPVERLRDIDFVDAADRLLEDGLDERVLLVEIMVGRGFVDTSFSADIPYQHSLESVAAYQPRGGEEDPLPLFGSGG